MDNLILIILTLIVIIISGNEQVNKMLDPDVVRIITWTTALILAANRDNFINN